MSNQPSSFKRDLTKEFDSIYDAYRNPENQERRKIEKRREEKKKTKAKDWGLC